MTQSNLGDGGNDPRALKLIECIESFLGILHERAPRSHAASVVTGDARLRGEKIRQEPERFVEEHLIRDVAEQVLGYDYRPQTKGVDGLDGRKPDFEVMNGEQLVLGETKKPNRIESARRESHEYLQMASTRPAVGISTDGWTWILHVAGTADSGVEYYAHEPLRPIIKKLGRVERHAASVTRRKLRENTVDFVRQFHVETLDELI